MVFQSQPKATLILYPERFVDHRAYAGLAQALSLRGCHVYLLKMPFNVPNLAPQKAFKLIKSKKLEQVYLLGHGKGGELAAQNVASAYNDKSIQGLILLSAYPHPPTDLSKSSLPILSITVDNEQGADTEEIQKLRSLLPQAVTFEQVTGGNHPNFADYQGKTEDASALSQQQAETARLIDQFISQQAPAN